jgi:class 3 adenylate cyclase
MDVHRGVAGSVDDLFAAHRSDLEVQEKHGVKYLRWWFNPSRRTVCCLVEAPSPEAAAQVHIEALGTGAVADKIVQVSDEVVEAFLGESVDAGLGWMTDPAGNSDGGFRSIVFTDIVDSTSMTQRLGDAEATRMLKMHDQIVRREIEMQRGRIIKHTGDGFMAAFPTASAAIRCAIGVQQVLSSQNLRMPAQPLRVRIGINAGEPVDDGEDLFGAAVQLARRVCDQAPAERIWVANVVRELCLGKGFEFAPAATMPLKGFEESVPLYEVVWKTSPTRARIEA